ncbi:hypothetical protein PHYBLDRAFT_114838, partial [Phycomyces blakesleeanus NRRL 1555(-)]
KQWETVIWSDKLSFMLYKKNSSRKLWCKTSERFGTNHFVPKVRGNDKMVMVWGCI